jgi:hypothetical protein
MGSKRNLADPVQFRFAKYTISSPPFRNPVGSKRNSAPSAQFRFANAPFLRLKAVFTGFEAQNSPKEGLSAAKKGGKGEAGTKNNG